MFSRSLPGIDNVLDGVSDEAELPKLPGVFPSQDGSAAASFVSEGDSYPDWTDDRLYRLADEAELFVELYNARAQGRYAEARQQARVLFDLLGEDGR